MKRNFLAFVLCFLSIQLLNAQTIVSFSVTGNSNWTVPAGVSSISVKLWGGGGGGGSAKCSYTTSGGIYTHGGAGGGGGGAFASHPSLTVTPGENLTIVVGSGGAAGANGSNGGSGSISQLKRGTIVLAQADFGSGGTGFALTDAANISNKSGGAGGLANFSTGTLNYNGGNGGFGARGTNFDCGGGGGESGNSTSNGDVGDNANNTATAVGGSLGDGGNGGDGKGTNSSNGAVNGLPGVFPGGGGGGGGAGRNSSGTSTANGGAGAGGYIEISYVACTGNVTASNNGPYCPGQNVSLSASGGTNYSWSGPNGFSSSQQNPFINNISSLQSGTYSVIVTDAGGCVYNAATTLVVNASPTISISATDTSICVGSSTMLTASGAISFVWNSGNTSATENSSPVASTTYSVTGTGANGCSNTATFIVTVNPLPVITIDSTQLNFCITDAAINLSANPATGSWSGTGISGNIFDPAAAGQGTHTVVYSVTDGNGCYNVDSISLGVDLCTAVADISQNQFLSVFPNPSEGLIHLQMNYNPNTHQIFVYNLLGEEMLNYLITNDKTTIDLTNKIEKGIYFLRIKNQSGKILFSEKIVVQ